MTAPTNDGLREASRRRLCQFVEDDEPWGNLKGADIEDIKADLRSLLTENRPTPPADGLRDNLERIRAFLDICSGWGHCPVPGPDRRRVAGFYYDNEAAARAGLMPAHTMGLIRETVRSLLTEHKPISGDVVMVPRAELEDFAHVIANLIGEVSDPGSGALATHYRINRMLMDHRLAAAPPATDQGGER